jgi:hypothetical protein
MDFEWRRELAEVQTLAHDFRKGEPLNSDW